MRRAVVAALGLAACGPGDPTAPACDGLVAGDLVITEIFADHAASGDGTGADLGKEWFEVYNASGRDLDLGGLSLVHSRADGSGGKEHVLADVSLPAGGYLVLGNVAADLIAAPVGYGYGPDLGDLHNSGGGQLAIACGAAAIDTAVYGDSDAGRSMELDGGAAPDATINDEAARWCAADPAAATEFEPGNFGTPGAANDACGGIVAGQCRDGDALRPVVAPAPGDLTITEVMPNPDGDDGMKEWIELRASRAVDLHGLRVGRTAADAAWEVAGDACVHVDAGGYAVLARSADPAVNGGLPAIAAVVRLSLPNRDASVAIAAADGSALDLFAWTTVADGVSIERGDDPEARCQATAVYGDGGRGTPGGDNDCGRCRDGDGPGAPWRPIRTPGPGDLAITEWIANPDGVPSDGGEYFELQARAAVDLNGVAVGRRLDRLEAPLASERCVAIAAGGRALYAHSRVAAENGGLPAVDGTFAFSLVQSQGSIVVAAGGAAVAEIAYPSSTATRATIVDDRGATCAIAAEPMYRYNGTDHGTPRAANPVCP